ncbi:hypothetical protein CLCR_07831 [Cladophialophora carrionii]|uniref:Uncharacterized protein n=1 Tax=Cladophialophora carrionii TaxID=86049 RepID=A0A1C1CMQ1_9EURO|nr:hypothetical protein CLCR_07831 [Cladophialophora carrionii]
MPIIVSLESGISKVSRPDLNVVEMRSQHNSNDWESTLLWLIPFIIKETQAGRLMLTRTDPDWVFTERVIRAMLIASNRRKH